MKFTPILFSTAMVQAILEGRKTQTRRIVKPQPVDVNTIDDEDPGESTFVESGKLRKPARWGSFEVPCKYGGVGSILWVKETWAAHFIWDGVKPSNFPWDDGHCLFYRADGEDANSFTRGCTAGQRGVWRTSRFMPKAAARIWLRIIDIRVERLQDISQKDALAEGVDYVIDKITGYCGYNYKSGGYNLMTTPYNGFCSLWKSINGEESWKTNPWVWVIEFERIEKPTEI